MACLFLGLFACLVVLVSGPRGSSVMADSGPFHLRIGFSSKVFVNAPKEDIKVAIKLLSQKVGRKTVGSAESTIYESSDDIVKELKAKMLDVMALTSDEFLYLRTRASLEPVMVTVVGNTHEIELFLLARKDSGLSRFADLGKRTIAVPSESTQFGGMYRMWIDVLVMKDGVGFSKDFFPVFKEARNASQAIMPVFFRTADACVTSNRAFDITSELNPQLARDLKPIARLSHLIGGIIAFRQDLPDERKQKVRQVLQTLHEDQEGKQMFLLFQLTRFAPFLPEYLKATEMLYAEHSRLLGRRR